MINFLIFDGASGNIKKIEYDVQFEAFIKYLALMYKISFIKSFAFFLLREFFQ